MIRLNIISRIAGDKDFFSHYLETVSEIFSENNITIFVNFIGPIEDLNTYNKIIKYCTKHGIEKQISFTKKALPYCEIENTKKDVFLNKKLSIVKKSCSPKNKKKNFGSRQGRQKGG